eukprot:m.196105 g.196105  ORF g.196105 m.196105 type:complete len:83 (+) comp15694_c0_seq28:2785-3033(+)
MPCTFELNSSSQYCLVLYLRDLQQTQPVLLRFQAFEATPPTLRCNLRKRVSFFTTNQYVTMNVSDNHKPTFVVAYHMTFSNW